MPEVDPDDDQIERYVVRHYRYDVERSERRHVVVAAYDTAPELEARIERESALLEDRRVSGETVDPHEYISGVVHEAGHSRLAANGRMVRRAFDHGVWPGEWVDQLDLPSSTWLMRSSDVAQQGEGSSDNR
jgi:hypothetical protein